MKGADTIFLVTQAGISELRNSNRLISQFFQGDSQRLEIVINKYDPHSLGVTEEHIAKALTMPAGWKIPDDYSSARQMQGGNASEAEADTPTSRVFRQMARSICGLPAAPEKKPVIGTQESSQKRSRKASNQRARASHIRNKADCCMGDACTHRSRHTAEQSTAQRRGNGSGNLRIHAQRGIRASGWERTRCG